MSEYTYYRYTDPKSKGKDWHTAKKIDKWVYRYKSGAIEFCFNGHEWQTSYHRLEQLLQMPGFEPITNEEAFLELL